MLGEFIKRMHAGDYRAPDRITLGDYSLERLLPTKQAQMRPSTFSSVATESDHSRLRYTFDILWRDPDFQAEPKVATLNYSARESPREESMFLSNRPLHGRNVSL